MAFLRLQKRGATAPTYVSGINWSSPLAYGLSWCWSPFAGWDRTHDTPSARGIELAVAGGFGAAGGHYGAFVSRTLGLDVGHRDGSSIIADLRNIWDVSDKGGSWLFRGLLDAIPSGTNWGGFWRAGSAQNGTSYVLLDKDRGNTVRSQVNGTVITDNGTWGGIQSGFYGTIHVAAGGPADRIHYVNGKVVLDSGFPDSQPTTEEAGGIFRMGYVHQNVNDRAGGVWQDVRFYRAHLSDEQHRANHTHPYDIYKTQARTYFLGSSTTSTIPGVVLRRVRTW